MLLMFRGALVFGSLEHVMVRVEMEDVPKAAKKLSGTFFEPCVALLFTHTHAPLRGGGSIEHM